MSGRRRLQAAGQEDLLLGHPGHRLEYAGNALNAFLMRAMNGLL
jgi:hypothetical protein